MEEEEEISMFFEEYFPEPNQNRLKEVGDVFAARKRYYQTKPKNLHFLLKKRYEWMNQFLQPRDKVLEVGCGMGISKEFIRKDVFLTLTDIEKYPWTEQAVDALDTKLPENYFDVVFCSNVIHHLAFPLKFLQEMNRILKPGGKLIIQEGNLSLMSKIMLRLLRHEGWSYKAEVFNLDKPCNNPKNPWSGNNAIPNLLFDDLTKFQQNCPYFNVQSRKYSEFFIFPLSGGVTAKAKTINLPWTVLRFIDKIDKVLVYFIPSVFALQQRVVLVKV